VATTWLASGVTAWGTLPVWGVSKSIADEWIISCDNTY